MLDYSEPSSRVFLFESILLLVVPTAAVCSSKGMIPLETIKRDMTTLGVITKSLVSSLPYRSLKERHGANTLRAIFHTAMHKYHIPLLLMFSEYCHTMYIPALGLLGIAYGFCLDPLCKQTNGGSVLPS